jgi:hypothetical protein
MNKIISSFIEFNNRNGSNEIFYRVPSVTNNLDHKEDIPIMLPNSNINFSELKDYLYRVYNIKINKNLR